MYLTELYLENTGPISTCHVKPPFAVNGHPLPIVVVGPNGSGKSILLSYIADALITFTKQRLNADFSHWDDLRDLYFRTGSERAIRSSEPFSLGLLRFNTHVGDLYYCDKVGTLNWATLASKLASLFDQEIEAWRRGWRQEGSYKSLSFDSDVYRAEAERRGLSYFPANEIVEDEMGTGTHAFFPATRREDPDWLDLRGLEVSLNTSSSGSDGQRDKPLVVRTCAAENISWILDVLLDSSLTPNQFQQHQKILEGDITPGGLSRSEMEDLGKRVAFQQARQNVESILQTILQDDTAKLRLNFRDVAPTRLAIELSNGQVIPNLQALSEGQSQLLHLFATIIRYGESDNLDRSNKLSEITGLVVIDEIDVHLHAKLQHDVVPQLIKLFPKVQFIVSSHSPLFLLGMEETFGADGLAILELPTGNRINSERFTEFREAFEYYRFEERVEQRFADGTKPLVLTEGPLDTRYIKTALTLLGEEELLDALEIEFVGIEDNKGTRFGGDKGLNNFRNIYEANPSLFHPPILLLYDCDTKKLEEQVGRLWVRAIPTNDDNIKVKKGIENLFPESLFQDSFYREISLDDGGTNKHLDKNKLCDWICDERKNPDDFAKFVDVVKILKEFVAQSPTSV